MDTLGQSSPLVGVVSFALGFSVLSRNVRNILFLSFAVLTTIVSAWAMSFFLDKIWPEMGYYRLHLLFNVLLAPAGLGFSQVMVRVQDRTSKFLFNLSILLALFLAPL